MIAETLLALVTAHLVADFLGQTDWMVREKGRLAVLGLHLAMVLAATQLAIGVLRWDILAATVISHGVFDWLKTTLKRDDATGFAVDQAAHLLVAVILALSVPVDFGQHFILRNLPAAWTPWCFAGMALVAGTIATVVTGGHFIGKVMTPYAPKSPPDGTAATASPRAGAMIGRLERILILILMLIGQAQGIGFLVAAKSILRFGEVTGPDRDGHPAEYVIIGTLLSFAWGIGFAYLTLVAVRHWAGSA